MRSTTKVGRNRGKLQAAPRRSGASGSKNRDKVDPRDWEAVWRKRLAWSELSGPHTTVAHDRALEREAYRAKRELIDALVGPLPKPLGRSNLTSFLPAGSNVVGIGYGFKQVGRNRLHSERSLRVYVRRKSPRSELSARELIPDQVAGVPTDVIEVGRIRAHGVPCGTSVGTALRTDGSIGCLVQPIAGGPIMLLTCNHVIADLNRGRLGDTIFAPSLPDHGNPTTPIATLAAFPPIRFNGPPNLFDLAAARLISLGTVTPDIAGVGRVDPNPVAPRAGQGVEKHGRFTGTTFGMVHGVSEDFIVRFGVNEVAHFVQQLAIYGSGGAFSDQGDSGALVVDITTKRPVGLLIAGGGGISYATPMLPILGQPPRLRIL